ncbi:MAG TPA: thioredoxin family protein [Actinotalea sp.]|nr:thioredoxin family protein [Actinotalea sp.]
MIEQALVLVALLAVSSLGYWLSQRRNGRFHGPAEERGSSPRLTVADLGREVDRPATFVLVTSQVCSTCPQVRRVLRSVVAESAEVDLVEVAAEEHMDLVRRLDILRTPTVLLLDGSGTIRSRTSGPMRPDQARAALAALLPTLTRS